MTFDELRQKLQDLNIQEIRFDLDDYIEFVIQSNCADQVKLILQLYFGSEVKLEDERIAKDAVAFVEKWGGIRPNQTLFYATKIQSTDYAMIWPWCDGTRISVKVAQCRDYS